MSRRRSWKRSVLDILLSRPVFHFLLGGAIGTAWGLASRYVPAWLHLGITAAVILAVIASLIRNLREMRAMERELEDTLRHITAERRLESREPEKP